MTIDQARTIFNSYVDFANAECAKSGGRAKADAVAVFDGEVGEGRIGDFSIRASETDRVHKLVRGSDLKEANRITHQMFAEAVCTLFGVDGVEHLEAGVRSAMQTMSAEARPLTARRISIVAQSVNLALVQKGEANWASNRLDVLGEAVAGKICAFVKADSDIRAEDFLAGVKSQVADTLSAIRGSLFSDVKDAGLREFLQAVDARVQGAGDYETLVKDLREQVSDSQARFAARKLKPGSPECASAYGALNVVATLARRLDESAHLLGVRDVRANVAELRRTFDGNPHVSAYLDHLLDACSDVEIASGRLDRLEVGRLLLLSSSDYVEVVRGGITDVVRAAIDAEKSRIQAAYDADEGNHRILMTADEEKAIEQELSERFETEAWTNFTAGKGYGLDAAEAKSAFATRQGAFVGRVEKQLSEQVARAVASEKERLAGGEPGAGAPELSLLDEEGERAFVERMILTYEDVAWSQAKAGEAVHLDGNDIEDAFAEAYSREIPGQVQKLLDAELQDFEASVKKIGAELEEHFEGSVKHAADVQFRALDRDGLPSQERRRAELSDAVADLKGQVESLEKKISDAQKSRTFFGGKKNVESLERQLHALKSALSGKQKDLSEVETLMLMSREQVSATTALKDMLHGKIELYKSRSVAERERLAACRQHLLDSLATVDVVDVAALRKTLAAFRTTVAESRTWFEEMSRSSGFPALRESAAPESFTARTRFGLQDRENFVRRTMVSARGYLTSFAREEGKGLEPGALADLLARLEKVFSSPHGLPDHLLDIARGQCDGETNDSIARGKIEDQLAAYVGCLIRNLQDGTAALPEDGSLPLIEEATVKSFAEELERASNRGEEGGVSAFGNEALIDGACALVKTANLKGGDELVGQLQSLKALFTRASSAGKVACESFDLLYLRQLNGKLDAQKDGGMSVRRYLARLLKAVDRARDLSKPANRHVVDVNVREFASIARTLVEGAEQEAREATFTALPENVKPLVGFQGNMTLDRRKLVETFLAKSFLNEATFQGLDAAKVKQLLPFVSFVEGQGPNARAFKPFLQSIAADAFPGSLLTESSTKLLMDLVELKWKSDTERILPADLRPHVKGFGTQDAKDILCALSTDGLLNLAYRGVDDAVHPQTATLLSFIWSRNDGRAGGLPQICRQIFGKGINEVTKQDFDAVVARMAKNKKDKVELLSGVGVFADYDDESLGGLLEARGTVANLFVGGIEPLFAVGVKGVKAPTLEEITGWIGALRGLKEEGQSIELTLAGVKAQVARVAGGYLTVTVAGHPSLAKWIPATAEAMVASLTESALRHCDKYAGWGGWKMLQAMLPPVTDPAGRDLALLVVRTMLGADAVKLANVPTEAIRSLACQALEGSVAKNAVAKLLGIYEEPKTNAQAVLDLVARLDEAEGTLGKEALEKVVKIPPASMGVEKGRLDESLRWRVFAADLLAPTDSWKADAVGGAEERLRVALSARRDDLVALAAMSDDDLAGALGQLDDCPGLADAVRGVLVALRAQAGETVAPGNVDAAISKIDLAACSRQLRTVVERRMATLQKEFSRQFVDHLTSFGLGDTDLMSLYELAGTDSIDLTSGYGSFLKKMLDNYFTGIGDFDKTTILASVLRVPAAATAEDRISAMVKSAGPVFIKMLQGVPVGAVPLKLQKMMSDIKDSLPPIPERVARAQLFDIVQRSHGMIRGIEVVKSLGAASVGQALLCRVKTDANPDGEECVVKLLRPNVQSSAQREIAFIRSVVAEPGKKCVFDSRLGSILRELDLTEEAVNVEAALAYTRIRRAGAEADMDRVGTMELHPITRPSVMTLVARKAPGETCEKFFGGVEARIGEILASATHVRKAGARETCYRNGVDGTVVSYKVPTYTEFVAVKDRLFKLYAETSRRQRDLLNLSYKWAEGLLFPTKGNGFLHGDLHAGNIMTDGGAMTFIDFGNAMKVGEEDRQALLRLLVPCSVGKADDFLGGLKKFKVNVPSGIRAALEKDLASALAKGTMNDTGLRFAAAVSLLQKYNVELPPVLSCFSQSMLRLQNAVERANDALRRIEGVLGSIQIDHALFSDAEDPFEPAVLRALDTGDLENAQRVTSVFSRAMRELEGNGPGKMQANIKALCLDEDGQFSPESVRTRLLPLFERHRNLYEVSASSSTIPPDDEKDGEVACRLVRELADQQLDLKGEDAQNAMLKLDSAVADLASRISSRFIVQMNNSMALGNMSRELRPPETFSSIFETCIKNHNAECLDVYDALDMLALGSKGYVGSLKAGLAHSDTETLKLAETQKINRTFLDGHAGFPVDVARKVTECALSGFVYEVKAFGPNWGETLSVNSRAYKLLRANVQRLRKALEQDGLDLGRDHALWGAKSAVELAMSHFGNRYDVFARIKELQQPGFDALLVVAARDGTLDETDKALFAHAMIFLFNA